VRLNLPSGTVTFLFTDVEGSTRLLRELGAVEYAEALDEHRRILREAFAAHGGVEVDTQGDAFFVAFPTAPGALEAAAEAVERLAPCPIKVRVGVHTGTPHVTEEGYVGVDVHRAARIAAVGHGGQVLVSASTATLVDAGVLRDLGEHRLKDLSEPERIHQLGDGEFPALRSLYRTNLPIPATAFLGREAELAELGELLAREDVHLLTLTGPGGTGKTRLALQAAADAADAYPDGVFWVPLAPLRDPELVLEEASQAVGAQDGLAEHIAAKRLLLLLDNFEHLVEAASGLSELLAACPQLRLLVTSRELLQLPGEQVYPVPPLAEQDGVELFSVRARASLPDFSPGPVVGELCKRLDNLPLALELAAARVRVLSPEQLLERLSGRLDLLKAGRGVDPRQQTLRATIEWSHELLAADEQRLFARLSIFRGGCTLEAAEEVAEADLDTLQSLVDKSLLRLNEERYWMLETIREYARERLEEAGEGDELRRRHAMWLLALAKEAKPHLRKESREWLDRLEREHDNIRAALDLLEASGESELVLELTAAVCWFWGLRGHLMEARDRVERALGNDERPTLVRADALMGAADFALDTGDHATARLRAEQALSLQRSFGDVWGAAYSLVTLGLAFAFDGEWTAAQRCFEESMRLFRELGDEHAELQAARRLAWSFESLGDRERARALYEDNLRRARASGDEFVEARALSALATYALDEGRIDEAIPMLEQSHRIHSSRPDFTDRWSNAINLCRFAQALALRHHPATAATLLSCFEALKEEMGVSEQWVPRRAEVTQMNEATRALIQKQLDEAVASEAWAQGRRLTADEAVALALAALD
jgi:predicted ATPase/class 3 adenylate cyclase